MSHPFFEPREDSMIVSAGRMAVGAILPDVPAGYTGEAAITPAVLSSAKWNGFAVGCLTGALFTFFGINWASRGELIRAIER